MKKATICLSLYFFITLISPTIVWATQPSKIIPDEIKMLRAIGRGNVTKVRSLLKEGNIDVSMSDFTPFIGTYARYTTYLIEATQRRQWACAKALLDAGADVNQIIKADDCTLTALSAAIKRGIRDRVKFLIEHGADPNCRTTEPKEDTDQTPLMVLCNAKIFSYNSRLENCILQSCAQVLLDHGAQVNAATKKGVTVLHYVAERGKLQLVEFLLENGADANAVDWQGKRAITYAKEMKQFAYAKCRLHTKQLECAKYLLYYAFMNNLDWAQTEYVALSAQTKKQFDEYAGKKLLSWTIDQVNSSKYDDLSKKYDDLNALLSNQDHPIKKHARKYVTAKLVDIVRQASSICSFKKDKIIEILIKHGASPNACDQDGYPLLINAIRKRNIGLVSKLVDNGANVNMKEREGKSPLMHAVLNLEEAIPLLLDHGAKVDSADHLVITPLQKAQMSDSPSAELLYRHALKQRKKSMLKKVSATIALAISTFATYNQFG